jgi:hypothetical protein
MKDKKDVVESFRRDIDEKDKIRITPFQAWMNICPFYKRNLVSTKDISKIAKKFKMIKGFSESIFEAFLAYLKTDNVLFPVWTGEFDKSLKFRNPNILYFFHSDHLVDLFHPIQILDTIRLFQRYYPMIYGMQEFWKFQSCFEKLTRLETIIKDRQSPPEFNDVFESDEEKLKTIEVLNQEINLLNDSLSQNHQDLKKKLNIFPSGSLFSKQTLAIWIKIEMLQLNGKDPLKLLGKLRLFDSDHFMYESLLHPEKGNEIFQHYLSWRKANLDNNIYITPAEIKLMKEGPYFWVRSQLNNSDFDEKWQDLFESIPNEKILKLKGNSFYFVNILRVKRYIEKIIWKFAQDNIDFSTYRYAKKLPPHHYCSEGNREEWERKKFKLLADFDLFVRTPFILYVEGGTEITLLNEYKRRALWINISIQKMGGSSGSPKVSQVMEDLGSSIKSFFFLDYDNPKDYQKIKDKLGNNARFFFPDFVTENFTAEDIFGSFSTWFKSKSFELTEGLAKELEVILQAVKDKSRDLIEKISKNEVIEEEYEGFEKVLIEFIDEHLQSFLEENYYQTSNKCLDEQIQKWKLSGIEQKEKGKNINYSKEKRKDSLEILVKTELANVLCDVIDRSIVQDKNRKKKFSFEEKLHPFLQEIDKALKGSDYGIYRQNTYNR